MNVSTRIYPNCEILRVIDGDTIDVRIDHGFRMFSEQRVRLAGLNAPELHGPGGSEARAAVELWRKEEGSTVTLETDKPDPKDRYGRYLARVVARSGRELGADLIASGHAVRWNGRGARP